MPVTFFSVHQYRTV